MDMGAEKPRLKKNWILKNLDLDNEKCGKQVDAEKWLEDYATLSPDAVDLYK